MNLVELGLEVWVGPHDITTAVAFVAFVALAMPAWRTIASAIIWPECATVRLRVLFEQQHALLQGAKLAVNLCDDWLNERRNGIFHVLYDAQCHLNHGFHGDGFKWRRRTTHDGFAPIANAFPVLVDLLMLNLHNANHDFAKTVNVVHQIHYGVCIIAAQCNAFCTGPISVMVNCLLCNGVIRFELTFNTSHVDANQRGALGHAIKVCLCRWGHFLYNNKWINRLYAGKLEYGLPLGLIVMSHFQK